MGGWILRSLLAQVPRADQTGRYRLKQNLVSPVAQLVLLLVVGLHRAQT
jgi:hypothetical protein